MSGTINGLIATHTPHRGRNLLTQGSFPGPLIATHTPHRGRNILSRSILITAQRLQLTRPTGDETAAGSFGATSFFGHCNSHAPQGTKRNSFVIMEVHFYCNSHAPQGTKRHSFCLHQLLLLIATHTPHRGRNGNPPRFADAIVYCNSHAPQGTKHL